MKIKLNYDFGPYRKGQIIDTPADKKGVPIDQYWRRRLEDAALDKCCEVVKESKPKASPKAKVADKSTSTEGED